ncbi:hypothetical protein ACH518_18700 [Methylomonas sp. HW2-6]|uniref:hypothetical protein n=1 Tax=Methylomonas sp. HW2-6 TaxID=3376687 RepID=UPI0040436418
MRITKNLIIYSFALFVSYIPFGYAERIKYNPSQADYNPNIETEKFKYATDFHIEFKDPIVDLSKFKSDPWGDPKVDPTNPKKINYERPSGSSGYDLTLGKGKELDIPGIKFSYTSGPPIVGGIEILKYYFTQNGQEVPSTISSWPIQTGGGLTGGLFAVPVPLPPSMWLFGASLIFCRLLGRQRENGFKL